MGCDLATEQQKVASLSEKSSVFHPFIHPSHQLLTTIDLFTVSRVLPFPEYHGLGTLWFWIQCLIFLFHFAGYWAEGPGAKESVDVIASRSWGPLVTSPSPESRRFWVKQGEWHGEGQSQPPDPCDRSCCLASLDFINLLLFLIYHQKDSLLFSLKYNICRW